MPVSKASEAIIDRLIEREANLLPVGSNCMRILRSDDFPVCANCLHSYSVNRSKPATAKRLKQLEERGASMLPLTRPLPFDLETEEEYLEEMKKREGRDPIE